MQYQEAEKNLKKPRGTLYLCATPIGNLEDITLRVLRTLREVDLIAAEDTRNSSHLLNHFHIHTPLTSYHKYNRLDKAYQLVERMEAGDSIALITDAGTPGISDPGEDLVRICLERGITVTSLPGAAACITALSESGLPTRRFAFEAFLPADKKGRSRILSELKSETRTIVIYEAPHHLRKTLDDLLGALGNRRMTICRELTKCYETILPTTLSEAVDRYTCEEPRGEYVLVLEGRSARELECEQQAAWKQISVTEHLNRYTSHGLDRKEAMKRVAKDRGIGKREVYRMLLDAEKADHAE